MEYDDAVKAHGFDTFATPNQKTRVKELNNIQELRKTGMWIRKRRKRDDLPVGKHPYNMVKKDFKKKVGDLGKSLLIRITPKGVGHWVLYDSECKNKNERIKDPAKVHEKLISIEKFIDYYRDF